ncbi:MAG TPA: chemotaxis protein CheB [Gemmatimonadaceae bacterium]|jgi:two-component system chemotaxis response regulator CheB|nr:chemotaxis protein CheB [Gemmatimonadaceae bacterium]
MAGHDIIVIGGSAGGIEALMRILATLPPDLPAAVCVVVHQAAYLPNRRPEILGRASVLPVVLAEHGMRLRPGTVYLSVPDQHLFIERGTTAELGVLRLVRGPKENRSRPAIDPLFRSAALAFGRRVIGVMLSGALDDGTSGLWVIKDCGGISVVQDPTDALVSSMPSHAIEEVGADHIVPASAMGALLGELARTSIGSHTPPSTEKQVGLPKGHEIGRGNRGDLQREIAIAQLDDTAHASPERVGVPSRYACPDCGGVLWAASPAGAPLHFRCETGHAYSAAALAEGQTEAVESAMWAALRALEDKADLARLRGGLAHERGLHSHAEQYDAQLHAAQEHAAAIRALLRVDGRLGIRPTVPESSSVPPVDEGGDRPVRQRRAPHVSGDVKG